MIGMVMMGFAIVLMLISISMGIHSISGTLKKLEKILEKFE